MIKKCVIYFFIGISLCVMNQPLYANEVEEYETTKGWKKSTPVATEDWSTKTFGLGLTPAFWGGQFYNEKNEIIGQSGVNIYLGYSSKHYYSPLKLNSTNTYWHWGTLLVAIPYIGWGIEYVADNGFFISASTLYIFPVISMGLHF